MNLTRYEQALIISTLSEDLFCLNAEGFEQVEALDTRHEPPVSLFLPPLDTFGLLESMPDQVDQVDQVQNLVNGAAALSLSMQHIF